MSVAAQLPSSPAIGGYTALIQAVASNLNRDDLSASFVPIAIANAERGFNRLLRVRPMLATATVIATGRDTFMPNDFLKMHYATRKDGMEILPASLHEVTRRKDFTDGVEIYAQIGGVPPSIRLSPAPSSEMIDIIYFGSIPYLSENQVSNWLLTAHHDLYYYAAIAECEGYLRNDEWLAQAVGRRDQAIAEIIEADKMDRDPRNDVLRTELRDLSGRRSYRIEYA